MGRRLGKEGGWGRSMMTRSRSDLAGNCQLYSNPIIESVVRLALTIKYAMAARRAGSVPRLPRVMIWLSARSSHTYTVRGLSPSQPSLPPLWPLAV